MPYDLDVKALLIGNYGVSNVGDEALKDYFLSSYPRIEWMVLSANPQKGEYPRLPFGVRSLFKPWWKTLGAYIRCDAIVFGGGSLFTDSESTKAPRLWGFHVLVAVMFRKKIFLAFQGIGPVKSSGARWWTAFVLRHAAFISVRDGESLLCAQSLAENLKIVQTFDPVFSLCRAKKIGDGSKNVFSIIPRFNSSLQFAELCQKELDRGDWQSIDILLLQPGDPEEQACAAALLKLHPTATVKPMQTFVELLETLAHSGHVVSQRYHGALAALGLGVPVTIVPQKPGDKLSSLLPYATGERSVDELMTKVTVGQDALRDALNQGKMAI